MVGRGFGTRATHTQNPWLNTPKSCIHSISHLGRWVFFCNFGFKWSNRCLCLQFAKLMHSLQCTHNTSSTSCWRHNYLQRVKKNVVRIKVVLLPQWRLPLRPGRNDAFFLSAGRSADAIICGGIKDAPMPMEGTFSRHSSKSPVSTTLENQQHVVHPEA